MIQNFTLIDKTYEDLINDAFYQIPLICKEWTNFNPSDPGVTILEILSATNVVQESEIDEMTDVIRKKLLALPGIYQETTVPSSVYMSFKSEFESIKIPAHTGFTCGEITYENQEECEMQNITVVGGFSEIQQEIKSFPNLSGKSISISINLLGKNPKYGDMFYLLLDRKPIKEKSFSLYLTLDDGDIKRNPVTEACKPEFARLNWQYYTEKGWKDIAVTDNTQAFLYSGKITFNTGDLEGIIFKDQSFAIRCVVEYADYDIAPKVRKLDSNIFEAVQQKSLVAERNFSGGTLEYYVDSSLLRNDGIFSVFVKEGEVFREYIEGAATKKEGRFYKIKDKWETGFIIEFHKSYKNFLSEGENKVKIVMYAEELLGKMSLGPVYAYDNQILETNWENLVENNFKVLLKQMDKNGVSYFEEVIPGKITEEGFLYEITPECDIKIVSPGIAGDGELIVINATKSMGRFGNIREESTFSCYLPEYEGTAFYNPSRGNTGKSTETVEDMRKRFIKDFGKSVTAVTATDYKNIVKETAGLAIKKVNVGVNYESNLVKITVMPYSKERFPQISKEYKKHILARIEKHRLLTTRVTLEQPKYVPVDVSGTIYVKSHFDGSHKLIEELLAKELDFINSEKDFGSKIVFGQIYNKIEGLSCVEYIYNLSFKISGAAETRFSTGEDIQLEYNELCYLGALNIEILNKF